MPIGNSPSISICMSTSLDADISIVVVCRFVFTLRFVGMLFEICISISDSVGLSIIVNLLILDLYYFHSCLYQ